MSARQLLHCLQQPLLHCVWPGIAGTAAQRVVATPAAQHATGLAAAAAHGSAFRPFQLDNWRGLATDAKSLSGQPWTTGIASSSSSSTQRQGPPQPEVLRPQMYAGSFRSPPVSLEANRGRVMYPPLLENNPLGRSLLFLTGAYSNKQQLFNGASILYQGITEAAENTQLQQAFGLEVGSFMAPFTLLSLHMWLIINRLDKEPNSKDTKRFRDALYHDFFYKDIERRVHAHGVQIRLSKWVSKLQQQFYGTSFAYDKAIRVEGGPTDQQAALIAALVKNVYDADESKRPWAELLSRYLLRELDCLHQTPITAVYKGHVRFSTDIVKR